MGQDTRRIRAEIDDTRQRMGETVEALSYKTDVKARTRDSISRKRDAVVGTVVGVKDAIVGTTGDVAGTVTDTLPSGEQIGDTARQAASVAQQNPLGLAIGSIAVGFLAGMILPSTRVEDERLGEAADQVKSRLVETGQQALEHGKAVAQDTLESASQTAQESARQHGEELTATAQTKAQQAVGEAGSAMKRG